MKKIIISSFLTTVFVLFFGQIYAQTPSNNTCGNADVLNVGSACSVHYSTNQGATDSGVASPACANYQGGDVWFTFTLPTVSSGQHLIVETHGVTGSNLNDTGLALYTGSCNGLSLVACDDDSGTNYFSRISVSNLTSGTVYYVRVWEYGNNSFGDFGICVYLEDAAPNDECANAIPLTVYPQGGGAGNETASSTLNATDSGNHPSCGNYSGLRDVWYSFTAPSSGSVKVITRGNKGRYVGVTLYNNNCSGAEVDCQHGGEVKNFIGLSPGQTYILRAWHSGASWTIGDFTIVLETNYPPSNDICTGAQALTVYPEGGGSGHEISVNMQDASDNGNPPSCDSSGTNMDLWYSFTAPSSGNVKVITGGNRGDYVQAALYSSCNSSALDCQTRGSIKNFTGLTSGQTYYLRIWEDTWDAGNITLVLEEFTPVSNDECNQAQTLTVYPHGGGSGNETAASTSNASDSNQSPSCDSWAGSTNLDIWYTFVAPASGSIKMITGGSKGSYVEAALYDSCGGTELSCQGRSSVKNFTGLTPGQSYILQVWHDNDLSYIGDFTIVLEDLQAVSNDNCASAENLTVYSQGNGTGHETSASTTDATDSGQHPSCINSSIYDLWYSFTAPASGSVKVTTTGNQGFYTGVAIYDSCGGTEVDCQRRGNIKNFVGLTPGHTYYLQVWIENRTGDFNIVLESYYPPNNDICAGAQTLTVYPQGSGPGNEVTANTNDATDSGIQPSCDGVWGRELDLWYSFTAPASGNVKLVTGGNKGYYIHAALYDNCNGNELECDGGSGLVRIYNGLTPGNTYYLQLWHDYGDTGEFNVYLEEFTPAANDECANAETLTVYPQDGGAGNEISGNTTDATDSGQHPSCIVRTIHDLWYTFTAPQSGNIKMITGGSRGYYLEAALYDSCGGNEVECQSSSGNEKVFRGLTPGNTYTLQVWHDNNDVGDFNLVLEEFVPPANDECANAETLTVYPQGGGPGNETMASTTDASDSGQHPSCDNWGTNPDLWYSFTAPASGSIKVLTGGTSGAYIEAAIYDACNGNELDCQGQGNIKKFTGLTPGNTYLLQVWHDSWNAGDFSIVLEEFTPAANDDCANAETLTVYPQGGGVGNETMASTTNATDSGQHPSCDTWGPNYDLWYSFTAPSSGKVKIFTNGTHGTRLKVALYDNCGGNEFSCISSYGVERRITGLTPGNTYLLQVWHDSWDAGDFSIVLEEFTTTPPANDECANAETLTVYPQGGGAGNETMASTTDATDSGQHPSCDNSGTNPDLWYSFTAPASGSIKVLTGETHGTGIKAAVYDACNGNELDCQGWGNVKKFTGLTPGNTYILQVWHDSWNAGDFSIVLEEFTPPANDVCANAETLTVYPEGGGAGNETMASTTNATDSGQHPSCAYGDIYDLWYSFTAPSSGAIKVTTDGDKGRYIFAAVYDNCGGTVVGCQRAGGVKRFAGLTPGSTYILQVWHTGNNVGDFNIVLEEYPAFNDSCANAETLNLGTTCTPQLSSNVGATDSGVASPGCAYYRGGDVWFSFTVPSNISNQKVIIETSRVQGSNLTNTGMALYTGDCNNLNLVACDDDEGDARFSRIQIMDPTPGAVYFVRVWSYRNYQSGEFNICAYLQDIAPNDECANAETLTVYPQGGGHGNETWANTLSATDSHMYNSCGTYNNLDLWYEFVAPPSGSVNVITGGDKGGDIKAALYNNCGGVSIDCQSYGTSKIFTGLTPGQTYIMQVWHYGGDAGEFSIVLEEYSPIANDDCPGAESLTVYPAGGGSGNETVATTIGATDSGQYTNCDTYGPNLDLWYSFVAPANGNIKVITGGDKGEYIKAALYDNCGNRALDCDYIYPENIFTGLIPGQTYILQVWHDNYNAGEFTIVLEEFNPPSNDECANATTLNVYPAGGGTGNETAGSTLGATDSHQYTLCDDWGPNFDVWYSFTAPASGNVKVLTGGTHGAYIEAAIYDACNGNELDCQGRGNMKNFTGLTPGNTYLLQVWHDRGLEGDFSIVLEEIAPAGNDTCSGAITLNVNQTCSPTIADNANALDSGVPAPTCASSSYNGGDLWYKFTVPSGVDTIYVETSHVADSDLFDTVLAVYSGDCSNLSEVACNNDNYPSYFSRVMLTNLSAGDQYFVRVFEYGNNVTGPFNICAYISNTVGVTTLSDEDFMFYPNPANQAIYWESSHKVSRIQVTNLMGQILMELNKPNSNRMDISTIPPGVYLLKVSIGNKQKTYRLIKE